MSSARRFTVLTTGQIEPGFDETQVALDFVSLLNTTPERAIAFIYSEQQLVVDVDEARALAYQKKLSDIGMQIRIVDSGELHAANDANGQQPLDSDALELIPTPTSEEWDGDAASVNSVGEINLISPQDVDAESIEQRGDTEAAEADVPDSTISQVASEGNEDFTEHTTGLEAQTSEHENNEALQSDIVIPDDEDTIISGIIENGNAIEDTNPKPPVLSLRNRSLRLFILALISSALVGFIYFLQTENALFSSVDNTSSYQYTDTSSDTIHKLMKVSGINDEMTRFSNAMLDRMHTYYSDPGNSSVVLTEQRYSRLISIVPHAYNKTALHGTVASWVQKHTFEDDIPVLIDVFSSPEVSAFIKAKGLRDSDTNKHDFQEFQKSLVDTPLAGDRNRAITQLFDALVLDNIEYEIEGDTQRAVIAAYGAIRPNKDSTAVKEKVRKEIKDMRDTLVYSRDDIRRYSYQELSWQLEEFSVAEINAIRSALDNSSIRELYRQMSKGYEEFLKNSTLWLQRQL